MNYFNIIIWAFITDVIDYQEVQTGEREDGTVYAVYSFSRKIEQALAGGLGGFALTTIGYASTATVQNTTVLGKLYSVASIVPAIGSISLLVAACLFFIYPLDKNTVNANVATLSAHRNQQ